MAPLRRREHDAVAFRHVAAAANRARLGRGRVPADRDQARSRTHERWPGARRHAPRPPSGSLGLVPEAPHSGTDLAAALLTFFAVSVAVRPADSGHPYGHGKPHHLAARAEARLLSGRSL